MYEILRNIHYPADFTTATTGLRMFALLVSRMQPFITISSIMKCAFSMLNIMSNSQTFSKYLSRVSTKLWMNSRKLSSLMSSSMSMPIMKQSDAYLLQITLYCLCSKKEHWFSVLLRHFLINSPSRVILSCTEKLLQYLDSLVYPCLLTIKINWIIVSVIDLFQSPYLIII